ncbi:Zinc finger GRF-type protein [Arachis hypogaea]|uniref:Zinc finger GRF-type protein n=1 Tax=Arachis hypogaea TaxID=3818 RepID=A0A6B9VC55_ARAHY|nr:Zinc finger GRF-type protein [Arachis hypogaea]
MSDSHASRRSNHSSATGNWKRNKVHSRRSAVPEWCGYGCRPVLRWSRMESHPNKPFFGCSNYNMSAFTGGNSVQDEVPLKSDEEDEHSGMKMNIAWKVGKLEADVRNVKLMVQVLGLGVFVLFVFVLMLLLKV